MRRRILGCLAVVLFLAGTACGPGEQSTPDNPPADLPGLGGERTLVRDADHRYRVVNLHSYNAAPGGAVDIYPAMSSDLVTLGSSPAPIVAGLAYGQATQPLEPGGLTGADESGYGLAVLPHAPRNPVRPT